MKSKLKQMINIVLSVAVISFSILPKESYAQESNIFVQDRVGVVSSEVRSNVKAINEFFNTTSEKPQVAIDVIPSLEGVSIEQYANSKFNELGVGNSELNNGVLIVVAIDDREFRIEVGYGLEGALTDSEASRILTSSTTFFRDGDYSSGIKNIFDGVVMNIAEEYQYDIGALSELGDVAYQQLGDVAYQQLNEESYKHDVFGIIIFLIFSSFPIICSIIRKKRKVYQNGCWVTEYYYPYRGSSSGGDSSFGGGSSGGGGASGSW